jgi:uncharacterized delta-60 repeat protein
MSITTYFGNDYLLGIAKQTDGKIVVCGSSNNNLIVFRYNTDGSPDLGFGTSGYVLSSLSQNGNSLAIQSDGKIVVSGIDGSNANIVILRLNTDGSLDTTGFGSPNGYVTYDLGSPAQFSSVPSTVIDGTGKIYLGVTISNYGFLVRLNTDGSLDTGWAGTGYRYPPMAGFMPHIAIDSLGQIVVAASWVPTPVQIMRYNTDGTEDATFNGGSVRTLSGLPSTSFYDMALDASNNIYLACQDNTGKWLVAKCNASDGSLDATWNATGYYIGAANGNARAVVIDGTSLVFGGDNQDTGNTLFGRFDNTGTLDATFGTGGLVDMDQGAGMEAVNDMILDGSGGYFATGTFNPAGFLGFTLRLNSDASRNSSFDEHVLVDGFFDEDFGVPNVGVQFIFPDSVPGGAFPAPLIATLQPDGIDEEDYGVPSVSAFAEIDPVGILGGGFGVPGIAGLDTLLPSGIVDGAFGVADFIAGPVTVLPASAATGEVFGTLLLSSFSAPQTVDPTGIGSALAFGVPGFAGLDHVLPTGFTDEVFGTLSASQAGVIVPLGIAPPNLGNVLMVAVPLVCNIGHFHCKPKHFRQRCVTSKIFFPGCSRGSRSCNSIGGAIVPAITVCNQGL